MGKAGRRNKERRQKRKQRLSKDKPILTSADANAPTAIVNPQSAVQRLRNPDPKVRHAALVALQASVLSQLTCSSRPINIKVLQAVREQVTNIDLECAAVASENIAQYLSITSSSSSSSNDRHKETIASWALVLLGRLDDCRKALLIAQEEEQPSTTAKTMQSKNQIKKRQKTRKQWYAVAAPCFRALCQLIENNGPALDRINLQKKKFLEVIFGILSLEVNNSASTTTASLKAKETTDEFDETMTDASNTAANTAPEVQSPTHHDAIYTELRENTALYAARCLHSALDDNWEIAEMFQHEGNTRDVWKKLLRCGMLSSTARLHIFGCLVNIYQLSPKDSVTTQSSSWQEDLLIEYGITMPSPPSSSSSNKNQGILTQTLFQQQVEQLELELSRYEVNYRNAVELHEKQLQDRALEEEIDAKVRERKESAKEIARRQKKDKEQSEKKKCSLVAEVEQQADAIMKDAEETGLTTAASKRGKIVDREQDGEEAVSKALIVWNSRIGQLQLALEILTNLVSIWIFPPPQNGNEKDCDMIGTSCCINKLCSHIRGHQISSKLSELLLMLCKYLRKGKKNTLTSTNINDKYETNDPLRISVEETASKIAACLTNCVLSDSIDSTHQQNVWEQILHDGLLQNMDSNQNNDDAINEAFLSVLAVLSKVHPVSVETEFKTRNSSMEIINVLQNLVRSRGLRHAVPLLSSTILVMVQSLCTSAAATSCVDNNAIEATVRSITIDFIAVLADSGQVFKEQNRVNIQAEILRTFMDWYGNDDFYPHLYNELQVSNAIVSCLVSIKSKLAELSPETEATISIDEEQSEILYNAERFVEYKKQQQHL